MTSLALPFFAPVPTPATRPAIQLRPYQLEALDRIDESLSRVRSALVVAATGTGKTTIFSEAIRRRPGRALVLAHRDELIRQASRRIHMQTGYVVSVEKAEEVGDKGADVVVASVQTLSQPGRLQRWEPDHFGLVVVDECHHATADTYRRILDHFGPAKVLGVTATPDRADEQAMGQVFEDVAYIYEIGDAIADGWLCRIRAKYVQCDSIDLSDVKTVAGDLNQGELEMVMSSEAALHQVARPTLAEAGGRRTVVFTTSVANAHRLAEVFCRYKPECARAVDGGTDPVTRRRLLADFEAGRFQFVVNVGVLTEGWDSPLVSCIAMGRPTKSRALYAQMAGRGTRIAPGKEDLLVLDFVGNAGRHKLVSAADVLGGKYADDVVSAAAKKVADEPGKDVSEALAEADAEARAEAERKVRAEEARRRAAAKTNVRYQAVEVDPFGVLGVERPRYAGRFGDEVATEKQLSYLSKLKVPAPENLSKREAMRLIGEIHSRREKGLCTFGQAKTLAKYGYDKDMSFTAAKGVMDALARNGWKRLPPAQLADIVHPEPGSAG